MFGFGQPRCSMWNVSYTHPLLSLINSTVRLVVDYVLLSAF